MLELIRIFKYSRTFEERTVPVHIFIYIKMKPLFGSHLYPRYSVGQKMPNGQDPVSVPILRAICFEL